MTYKKELSEIKELSSTDIKNIRKKYNLTQKDLADLLRCNIGNIQNWEQGFRKPNQGIITLLTILDIQGTKIFEF